MTDLLYFYCINRAHKSMFFFNLAGCISFYKSAIKHHSRKSPRWMVLRQVRGMFMCLKQMFCIYKEA